MRRIFGRDFERGEVFEIEPGIERRPRLSRGGVGENGFAHDGNLSCEMPKSRKQEAGSWEQGRHAQKCYVAGFIGAIH
jgi:hypothetical protein